MTDKDIIDELGVIPSNLKKLKTKAVEKYIVKMPKLLINPRRKHLEENILMAFKDYGLKEVLVFNTNVGPNVDKPSGVANIAAQFFKDNVQDGSKIVLSCGSTINKMINHLDTGEGEKKITVYSSIVLCKNGIERLSPPALVHNFTQRFKNSEGFTFHLPENIKELGNEKVTNMLDKAIFNKAMHADYFFLGIGALSKSNNSDLSGGFISMVDNLNCYTEFHNVGCRGEISYCPIIENNEHSPWLKDLYIKEYSFRKKMKNYFESVFTLNFKQLIQKKSESNNFKGKVVAIAYGPDKAVPIKTCLTIKNFIDVLITDSDTAQEILD